MSAVTDFDTAAERVKSLRAAPAQSLLLQLYALYKQATVGDVNIPQPWAVQVEARAKWDAWNSKKGMGREEAKAAYVKLANELIAEDEAKANANS